VIGLKVLSFAQSAHSRRASIRHALIFSLGIILSFIALALLLIAFRAAGEAIGWGFQLQSPLVVILLALLFVAIALNLAGVFEMGLLMSRVGNLDIAQRQSGSLATFGSGVLAVVVASPCTAPFMGGAIGFTATAGIVETLIVFAALGLGMALPYLLLSAWPALLSRMPKPGVWMVQFKQAMAFPMLAAAAWLFWVLATLQGPNVILMALLAAVLLALVLWIYGAFIQTGRARLMSLVWLFVALGLMVWSVFEVTQPATQPSSQATINQPGVAGAVKPTDSADVAAGQWQPWAPGLPEQLAVQGKTVFVDFTASWCISCQANKVRVLQSKEIIQAFQQRGVVLLRADWTRKDADIANELARHGRNGVPLYLVYSNGSSQPKILSEWLTNAEVLRAIR
jgi:thiol:disulfide interchange protein